MTEYREVHTEQRELGQANRVTTFKVTQLIWLLFGLLEAAIGLRVIFKLIAVNPNNAFAAFLYRVTDLFVAPFQSLIGAPAAEGMVLEVSSIIAMIVYALIAWALDRLAYVLFYRPRGGVSVQRTVVADHTQPPPPPEIDDRPL